MVQNQNKTSFLTKADFVALLNIAIDIAKREEKFNQDLQEYAQDTDFTGFHSDTDYKLVQWLEETMGAGDIISWWLYDAPDAGDAPDYLCDITFTQAGKTFTIKTPEDLYDCIVYDKDYPQLRLEAQTNGVLFAIRTIESIQEKVPEYSVSLETAKQHIIFSYLLQTNDKQVKSSHEPKLVRKDDL